MKLVGKKFYCGYETYFTAEGELNELKIYDQHGFYTGMRKGFDSIEKAKDFLDGLPVLMKLESFITNFESTNVTSVTDLRTLKFKVNNTEMSVNDL